MNKMENSAHLLVDEILNHPESSGHVWLWTEKIEGGKIDCRAEIKEDVMYINKKITIVSKKSAEVIKISFKVIDKDFEEM